MIQTLSVRASGFLVKRDVICADEADVYQYGLELLLSSIINNVLIIALALAFSRPLDAIIYMVSSKPLRRYGGGWHANSHIACISLQCLTFSAVSWVSHIWENGIPFVLICLMLAFSVTTVVVRSPVEHPDNPLQDDVKSKSRIKSICISLCLAAASLIAFLLGYSHISLLIAASMTVVGGTMLFRNRPHEDCNQSDLVQNKT